MNDSHPSTSTQTSGPPSAVQPYMNYGLQQARSIYDQGPTQYYPGETVVPFSQQTQQAMSGIEQRATNGSDLNRAATSYATDALGAPVSSQFGNAANPYGSSANPFGTSANPTLGAAANPFGNLPNDYASISNPYADASNPYGSASNPYLDATFNKAADSVQNRLSSQFAGVGRNIGASEAANADALNGLATQIYGGAYENERNRNLQYQQQLTGIGATGFENAQNRGLQYQQQLNDIGATGYENQQNRASNAYEAERARQADYAGQQLGIGASGYENERNRMATDLSQQRSNQLALAGLSPQLANQDYYDYQQLLGVGGLNEDLAGRQMQDAAARWDYGQNAPGNALDQYLQRIQGYPGSTSTISTPVYQNRGAGALGGAMAGYNVGSSLGDYGGYGALLGGLLGYFG